MKYIYILGLEHSGTTLTDHMLSAHPRVTGVGEVAQFFSVDHMRHYLRKWGELDDHNVCSCGQRWSECEFWQAIVHLNGAESQLGKVEKQKALISHFRTLYGDDSGLVDSSKSLNYLVDVYSNLAELGIGENDLYVVLCAKDPRGFVASMIKKENSRYGFIRCIRALNYWYGQHRQFVKFLKNAKIHFHVSTYETLCAKPQESVENSLSYIGFVESNDLDITHNTSHIAMGNKGFTMRNRSVIKYDNSWVKYPWLRIAYMCHWKARNLYRLLERGF